MPNKNYTYSFDSAKTPGEVFDLLLQVPQWWSGLYEETINGKSEKLNDEFSFKAGGGAHFSKQKLVELVPNKKVVWEISNSNLSFLSNPGEWDDTRIRFDISASHDKTHIIFSHEGLVPEIECYNECAGAWTKYMERLENRLS